LRKDESLLRASPAQKMQTLAGKCKYIRANCKICELCAKKCMPR